jgi:Bacterial Ig-like domain (group 1)
MRTHLLLRLTASATVLSLFACGGEDLVLPTDGVPGSESSAHLSTISVDPSSIEAGNGTSSIRVTVRDEQGEPVPGAVVTLSATGSGNTLVQPPGPTGADGVAVGHLSSTVAGTKDVSAVVNGTLLLNQSAQVFVTLSPEPPPPPPPPAAKPHHFIFVEPPHDVRENQEFTVRVAIVDAGGNIVPLSGIEIYIGLFRDGSDDPTNTRLLGDRFEDTRNGVAEFRFRVTNGNFGIVTGSSERYRMRALSDELPQLGPYGPEPFLYSQLFTVRGD